MAKDPEREARRAAEAARRASPRRSCANAAVDEDRANLERKAAEAGVPVDRYLKARRKQRNQAKRAKR